MEATLQGLKTGDGGREKATQATKVLSPVDVYWEMGFEDGMRTLSFLPLGKKNKYGDCLTGKQDTRKSELRWLQWHI